MLIDKHTYEYLEEELPGLQEDLVVLHEEGEEGIVVPVRRQNCRFLFISMVNIRVLNNVKISQKKLMFFMLTQVAVNMEKGIFLSVV